MPPKVTLPRGNLNLRKILKAHAGTGAITVFDAHVHKTSYDVYEQGTYWRYPCHMQYNGIDSVALTEHDDSPDLRVPENFGTVVYMAGIEVSCLQGHAIVISNNHNLPRDIINVFGNHIFDCFGKSDFSYNSLRDRDSVFSLDTLINYLEERCTEPYCLVFPHAFQDGGIFKSDLNFRPDKIWYPLASSKRQIFLEWTNSRRSTDVKSAKRVIETVADPDNNFILLAGSDAHESGHVGLAGVCINGQVGSKQIIPELYEKNYFVYHLLLSPRKGDNFIGKLCVYDPDASPIVSYNVRCLDYRSGKVELETITSVSQPLSFH